MINEIDIEDWKSDYTVCRTPVRLYDAPRGSVVTVVTMDSSAFPVHFSHIDGAYSFCTLPTGEVVHLSASTFVYVWSKK